MNKTGENSEKPDFGPEFVCLARSWALKFFVGFTSTSS